jgi:ribosomal protein S18 acetylase RimI-like enzyme
MRQKWSPRLLDPARDRTAVRELWELTLGASWPIHAETLIASMPIAYGLGDSEKLSGAIGFDDTGAISFVMVDPSRRREGIGTALHRAAVEHLAGSKPDLTLGGAHSFWRGIPDNLPDAAPFFTKLGWTLGQTVVDMARPTAGFSVDPAAIARSDAFGVKFTFATQDDAEQVITYEAREHPNWTDYFRRRFPDEPGSVLVGRDRVGEVVAALLIDLPPRHRGRWSRILGEDMAEIGCIGVAASLNGQGIGTAMTSLATAEVQRAGARLAFLAWTTRTSFYARIGYKVWHGYRMATRAAM